MLSLLCDLLVRCGKCLAKFPIAFVMPEPSSVIDDTLNGYHLDRLRRSLRTEEEWRDPDDLSCTMLTQGISTDALCCGGMMLICNK